jgi:hypothetical protein
MDGSIRGILVRVLDNISTRFIDREDDLRGIFIGEAELTRGIANKAANGEQVVRFAVDGFGEFFGHGVVHGITFVPGSSLPL